MKGNLSVAPSRVKLWISTCASSAGGPLKPGFGLSGEVHTSQAPLYTCWPVITEAAWLLRHSTRAVRQLLNSVDGGFLELLPLAGKDAQGIAATMKKYESMRPQVADAALVYLAGREKIETVFTLDRRDFSVYRASGRRALSIVP